MTSNIENELKAQVSEFAKSDEALKEIISRLSELESLISANQKSRESLDKTTSSISQLASNLGSFLTVSVDSVGSISKVSTEIGSTIQRIEREISSAVSSNLQGAAKEMRDAVSTIETVSASLKKDVDALIESQSAISIKVDQSIESINDELHEIERSITQEVHSSTTNTWMIIGASAVIIGLISYFV